MSQHPARDKVTLFDVKQALRDARFRERLPPELTQDVQKYLQNPGCACNLPIYRRVLNHGADLLKAYFPGKEVVSGEDELAGLAANHWQVISCHVNELEGRLTKLHPSGRKQIAVARWEDQVTVIINNLEYF
jgi:hypothetical protein